MKLKRYQVNPIIEPRGDDWEAVATFNCAALDKGGKIHVLYRAVGDYVRYASHQGYAVFDEDMNLLARPDEPVFGPDIKLWEMSIEDARLTEIENEVYMTYVVTPTPSPPGAVRKRLGIPKPTCAAPRTALAKVEGLGEPMGPVSSAWVSSPPTTPTSGTWCSSRRKSAANTPPSTGQATGLARATPPTARPSGSPFSMTSPAGCTATR